MSRYGVINFRAKMNSTEVTSTAMLLAQISVSIIILHFILPFTVLLVIVLVRKEALREKPQFIFFTFLMVSEVTIYLVRTLFAAMQLGGVPMSRLLCNAYQSLVSVYIAYDYYSLAAMSVDRCIAICWPLTYITVLSPVRVRNVVISIAVIAALVPSVLFLAEEILQTAGNPNTPCTVDNWTTLKTGQIRIWYSIVRVGGTTLVVMLSYVLIYREGRRAGVFRLENKRARCSILYHGLQLSLFILPTLLLQAVATFGRRISITNQAYDAVTVTAMVVFAVAQCLGLIVYGLKITELRQCMCRVLRINQAAIGVNL